MLKRHLKYWELKGCAFQFFWAPLSIFPRTPTALSCDPGTAWRYTIRVNPSVACRGDTPYYYFAPCFIRIFSTSPVFSVKKTISIFEVACSSAVCPSSHTSSTSSPFSNRSCNTSTECSQIVDGGIFGIQILIKS